MPTIEGWRPRARPTRSARRRATHSRRPRPSEAPQARVPPVLVARAGLDGGWINDSIGRFVDEALSRIVELELLTHPEGRHGFDMLDDIERSRKILRHTITFLGRHLRDRE
jgi:dienelactone hydrolase